MRRTPVTVRVRVTAPGDDVAVEQATLQLRSELLDLDVETVRREAAGEAPLGAKAVDAVWLDALLVTLTGSGVLLEQVVGLVRSWISRDRERAVTLEIGDAKLHLDDASSEHQRRLIEAWIDHVRDRGGVDISGSPVRP